MIQVGNYWLTKLSESVYRSKLRRFKITNDYSIRTDLECFSYIIRSATIVDGKGEPEYQSDVGIINDRIAQIGNLEGALFDKEVLANNLCLAPGFIDTHTHDDLEVLTNPAMLNKISQGVTTVIVGNCGISACPVKLKGRFPEPMNLLGKEADFVFPRVRDYARAVNQTRPAVNVAALVGHTALRNSQMTNLDRVATSEEINQMKTQLRIALEDGAIGLSSGLAYKNAICASAEEVEAVAAVLADCNGIYTTHLRDEFNGIIGAMKEAFTLGRNAQVPVIISHFKCAGRANWGRAPETIALLKKASMVQEACCDCYPYSAGSSLLDLEQITADFDICITWSEPYPEKAGQMLCDIAEQWGLSLLEAAERLQPAGAVYHNMNEADIQAILKYPESMIGSDGLPNDAHPHPRLWGTFPRVLAHYCRDLKLFELHEAIKKMTGLPASKFNLHKRGLVQEGYFADLVLFDPETIQDMADFKRPDQKAVGIQSVWVNGTLSYQASEPTTGSAGRFLGRAGSSAAGRG